MLLEGYHRLAHDLAIKATKDAAAIQALTSCDLTMEGEAACQKKFIDTFLPVVFRRPLEPTDRTDFEAVFAKGRELAGDFAGGVRAVVEVSLQSPEFLYRVELGLPVEPALARWRVSRRTRRRRACPIFCGGRPPNRPSRRGGRGQAADEGTDCRRGPASCPTSAHARSFDILRNSSS